MVYSDALVDDTIGHVISERVSSFGKYIDGLHASTSAVLKAHGSTAKKATGLSQQLKEAASLEHYDALKSLSRLSPTR